MNRRSFLLGSTALGLGVAPGAARSPSSSRPQDDSFTAEEALVHLMAGNERFVANRSVHPRMSEGWRERLEGGQNPLATVLACSDSRVPLELLFDQGFGDLFAIRIAGNVVTRGVVGSMEYAQHHLRTPLFMVLGHEGCGAVQAALAPPADREKEPRGVQELLERVSIGEPDSTEDTAQQATRAVEANVRNSMQQILDLDPVEEGFELRTGETLVAAVYSISTGRVRILEQHSG